MKFPCTLKNALLKIRDRFGLSFASKVLGYLAALLLLLSLLARYKLSCYQTTLLLTISALADITLLKTTCHFLLLLVGFDTLTYRKELQLIPYTCGSSRLFPGAFTRKGLTTPLTRRVARICYLCAGAVYVVLLGSPTGSITLVSYLREIPTAAVLHHPFLFGEIPM